MMLIQTALVIAMMGMPQEPSEGDLEFEAYEAEGPGGSSIPAELGRLWVRENRNDDDSSLIELAFVRFRCTGDNPGPPIIMLAGGPGGSGIPMAVMFGCDPLNGFCQYGDVIGLDQRGVGLSRPNLSSENGQFALDLPLDIPLLREDYADAEIDLSEMCREHWSERGIDLDAYNTRESAHDINDLRQALGVEKVVLVGASYGSHLALAVLRDHSAGVARALISKVEGPNHTLKRPQTIQDQLEKLHRQVNGDKQASEKVPDLLGLVKKLRETLEKGEVRVRISDPRDGRKVDVSPSWFDFQRFVANQLGSLSGRARLPKALWQFSKGDFDSLAYATLNHRRSQIYSAMQMRMDGASGATAKRLRQIEEEAPRCLLGDAINFPFPDVLDVWSDPDLGDSFREDFRSEVPILFVSGDLDARTPPSNVEEILEGFPKALHLVVNNAAHGPAEYRSEEMQAMVRAFFRGESITKTQIDLPPLRFRFD